MGEVWDGEERGLFTVCLPAQPPLSPPPPVLPPSHHQHQLSLITIIKKKESLPPSIPNTPRGMSFCQVVLSSTFILPALPEPCHPSLPTACLLPVPCLPSQPLPACLPLIHIHGEKRRGHAWGRQGKVQQSSGAGGG